MALKGNQGQLEKMVISFFSRAHDILSTAQDEIDSEHGRIEEMKIDLLDAAMLKRHMDLFLWSCLRMLARVRRTTHVKIIGAQTVEAHLYISSLEQ